MTADNKTTLIAHMELGRAYTIDEIQPWFAARLGVSATRRMLSQMVHDGFITKQPNSRGRQMGYTRGTPARTVKPIDPRMALPPDPPNLKSHLTGYDREISARREMCMMVRREG